MYRGLHHVAVMTGDMEKTIRFWRDLLGMRLVAALSNNGERQAFFEVSPGSHIAFFEWPNVKPVPYRRHGEPGRGSVAFDHISIAVDGEERLWELGERLLDADYPVSDVIDHGFILSLYSYDPNHIPLEFTFAVPGADISGKPLIADPNPPPALKEGSEPLKRWWLENPKTTPAEERVIVPGMGSELFDRKKSD